jgi:outer membrane lipoprotein-sorting protein
MTGRRQAAFIAIAMAGQLVAASIAAAQPVPLPPPAPLPKTGIPGAAPGAAAGLVPPGSVPQPSASVPNTAARPNAPAQGSKQTQGSKQGQDGKQAQDSQPAQGNQQAQSSSPLQQLKEWLPPFLGGGGGGGEEQQPQQQPKQQAPQQQANSQLEAKQRALVDKVSAYLTRVQVMSGDFAQIGPDGRQSKGQFYVQKPGKVRFDYDQPSRIDIIADGSSVVVRDRKLATQDVYPLSQTPLRFLLADRIDLLHDTTVTSVSADDTYVTVVVEEKQALIGTSRLMMMFGAKDFALKQWVVTDPQGYDTTVALSNLDTARRPDPSMFKIDYTQYPN